MASIVNLNHPASYAHWGVFQMSVPNLVVIALMLIVFAAGIWLRAPGSRRHGDKK